MTQAMSLLTTPDGTTLKGIRYSAILAVLSYYGPRQGRAVELPRNKAKAGVKEERQDPLFLSLHLIAADRICEYVVRDNREGAISRHL